jgi:hypothetical protein
MRNYTGGDHNKSNAVPPQQLDIKGRSPIIPVVLNWHVGGIFLMALMDRIYIFFVLEKCGSDCQHCLVRLALGILPLLFIGYCNFHFLLF